MWCPLGRLGDLRILSQGCPSRLSVMQLAGCFHEEPWPQGWGVGRVGLQRSTAHCRLAPPSSWSQGRRGDVHLWHFLPPKSVSGERGAWGTQGIRRMKEAAETGPDPQGSLIRHWLPFCPLIPTPLGRRSHTAHGLPLRRSARGNTFLGSKLGQVVTPDSPPGLGSSALTLSPGCGPRQTPGRLGQRTGKVHPDSFWSSPSWGLPSPPIKPAFACGVLAL